MSDTSDTLWIIGTSSPENTVRYNLLPLLWFKFRKELTTSPYGRLQKAVSSLWKRKHCFVKVTVRLNPAGSCKRESCQVKGVWFLKENLLRTQRNKAEGAMYVMPLSSVVSKHGENSASDLQAYQCDMGQRRTASSRKAASMSLVHLDILQSIGITQCFWHGCLLSLPDFCVRSKKHHYSQGRTLKTEKC